MCVGTGSDLLLDCGTLGRRPVKKNTFEARNQTYSTCCIRFHGSQDSMDMQFKRLEAVVASTACRVENV